MVSELKQQKKALSLTFKILLAILLVSGIVLRFHNLDNKVYWRDEAVTSLRISGYTWSEVIQQVYDGREIGVKDIQKYLHPNPEKGLSDTIQSLIVEDSQHPPVYYTIARFWAQVFGSSVAVMRSLSAVISLLTFPCLYWLCLELFESSLVAGVAIALTSVSLFHLMYAQEAREYVLWIVTILLSSAALLQAIRSYRKPINWIIYTTSITIGLYTFPLTALVVIAQGIYVFVIERFRLTQTFIRYLVSSISGFIFFTPWILLAVSNGSKVKATTNWLTQRKPWAFLGDRWRINIATVFFGEYNFLTTVLILILVGYSIYYVVRNTPKRVWLLILTLIIVPTITLMLPDLIFGGVRSTINRYLVPCYLGIQLAVAYTLTTKMTSVSIKLWQRKLSQIILIAILIVGFTRCIQFSQSEVALYRGDDYNIPMSRIVNRVSKPILISDESCISNVLSISYLLDSKVKLQLVREGSIPNLSNDVSNVFLYSPFTRLRDVLEQEQNRKSMLVYKDDITLWKLVNN